VRQVAIVLEIPRDYAYSRIYEYQYMSAAGQYNFMLVFNKVFLAIDDSLVAAVKREASK